MLFRFGPALLAVAATLLVALGREQVGPEGQDDRRLREGLSRIGSSRSTTPQVDGFYGMLPLFVESLGGKFVKSKDLSKQDLAAADVLLLLHPDNRGRETLERVWDYVRGGGSLLLVAEPAIHEGDSLSSFNDVLQPTAMQVRYDTAVTRTGNWEQSYEVLAHPATAGIDDLRNRFGCELGSSIRTRWPARPVLVGRWGWSDPGSDAAHAPACFVLQRRRAAGRPGVGRRAAVGRRAGLRARRHSPLHNEMLANAYPFVGRLLGYLAHRPSSPQALWRQLLGLAALLAMVALLALRPAAWQIMLTPRCWPCRWCAARRRAIGRAACCPTAAPRRPAASTTSPISTPRTWRRTAATCATANHGIAGLLRTLMRQGYLPLLAPDLTPERLERAGLLISIGPARRVLARRARAVKNFVAGGGTFICMVGAEEARAQRPAVGRFRLQGSALAGPAGRRRPRAGAAGRQFPALFTQSQPASDTSSSMPAGRWNATTARRRTSWVVWSDGNERAARSSSAGRSGGGTVVVIGDTHFAGNENLETAGRACPTTSASGDGC